MDGVSEVADVYNPHSHTDQGDDLGQLLAEFVQLLLQRRLLLLCGRHLITDFTDLRGNARSHYNTYGTACSNVGALSKDNKRNEWREEKLKKLSNYKLEKPNVPI